MNIKPETFNLVDSSLLEKIDALFACQLGGDVDLPQLIVVGQQSSGKSSVLEGLTGLPFPRDSSLCTRFATQIIFRRAPKTTISARIIPSKDTSSAHQEEMKNWGMRELTALDPESFAGIMREVIDLMGVGPNQEPGSPAFSKDVLVLEIADPSQEHFSVIDVPGTFKRTTQGVTTKEDIALVDNMVKGYMSNPRSVMLTVVPCNADIATQEVVEQAEDLDPDGDRTLGVLTKPDLVDKGAEKDIVDLIEGRKHKLKLGWHLLRNPGQADLTSQSKSRNELEDAFFRNIAPWNGLEGDMVGVRSLRGRLQEILAAHIRREFPKVKSDIQAKLRAAEKKLKGLGPARQGPVQQRQYLMRIAGEFQELVSSAVGAQYASCSEFFDEHDNHRVATRARGRGEEFSKLMTDLGHKFDFAETGCEDSKSEDNGALKVNEETSTRTVVDSDDIEDILAVDYDVEVPRSEGILDWLTEQYKRSIGFELGTFNPGLLRTTMQKQSEKWKNIAKGYVSDVITIAHFFVLALLEHIVPDRRVLEGLKSLLSDHLRDKYVEALAQTDSLLRVELEGTPATHNRAFAETLNQCRQERHKKRLQDKKLIDLHFGDIIRLDDVTDHHPLQNEEQMIQEIHDILKSYYLLSRTRFIDNVRMQAADDLLVTGPATPLKIFTPEFVSGLTDEQLDDVAGEDPSVRNNRTVIEEKISLLRKAMKILR